MKLTIIVPVYNLEGYLSACLDSILNQSFTDYELLLINDGSTDISGNICDDYASKFNKIKVFHQENSGVSVARNLGIEKAKGEYVCFIDGDDRIEKETLDKLSSIYDNIPIDLLIARSFIADGLTERYSFSEKLIGKSYKGIETAIELDYNRGSVCGVLFRQQFLVENKINFPIGLRNGEDLFFFTLCLIYAESVRFIDIHLYNVYERPGSASRNWTKEKVFHLLKCIDYINNYKLTNSNLSKEAINLLDYAIYRVISSMFNNLFECFSIDSFFKLSKEIKNRIQNKLDTGIIKTNKAKVKFLNFSVLLFGLSVLFNSKIRAIFSK